MQLHQAFNAFTALNWSTQEGIAPAFEWLSGFGWIFDLEPLYTDQSFIWPDATKNALLLIRVILGKPFTFKQRRSLEQKWPDEKSVRLIDWLCHSNAEMVAMIPTLNEGEVVPKITLNLLKTGLPQLFKAAQKIREVWAENGINVDE